CPSGRRTSAEAAVRAAAWPRGPATPSSSPAPSIPSRTSAAARSGAEAIPAPTGSFFASRADKKGGARRRPHHSLTNRRRDYWQLSELQRLSFGWMTVQAELFAALHSSLLPAGPWNAPPLLVQRVPLGKIVSSGRSRSWHPVPMPLLNASISSMHCPTVLAVEVP